MESYIDELTGLTIIDRDEVIESKSSLSEEEVQYLVNDFINSELYEINADLIEFAGYINVLNSDEEVPEPLKLSPEKKYHLREKVKEYAAKLRVAYNESKAKSGIWKYLNYGIEYFWNEDYSLEDAIAL